MTIKIEKKFFNKNHTIMKNIYNTLVLLENFCYYNEAIEEIVNITPVIKYLRDESDKLCFNFMHLKLKQR